MSSGDIDGLALSLVRFLRRWRPVALLAVVAGGCDVVLGIEDLPLGTPPPFAYATAECETCVAAACSAEEAACLSDDACRATHTCLAACAADDPRCRRDCEEAVQDRITKPLARGLDACRRQACAIECIGTRHLADHAADETCARCVDESCVSAALACVSSNRPERPELGAQPGFCERQLGCMGHTSEIDPNQVDRCYQSVAGGRDTVELLGFCAATKCDCPYAHEWRCVDDYVWDKVNSSELVAITFYGEPGTQVTACAAVTCSTCSEPYDASVVGEDESAVLDVGNIAGDVQVCFHAKLDGHFDAIVVPGRPMNLLDDGTKLPRTNDAAELAAVEELLDFEADLTRGSLGISVRNCWWVFAPGVRFEASTADDRTVRAYLVDGLLDADATATSSDGFMVFYNLPTGDTDVVAYVGENAVAHYRVPIVASTVTWLTAYPDTAR